MSTLAFETHLHSGHTFILPDKIAHNFLDQGYKRVIVTILFDDRSTSFHAAIQKFNNQYHITFNKANQKKMKIFPSDYFTVELTEDTSKYGVEMPEEFDAVLQSDPEAFEIFESLTDGKKRSLIYFILKIKNSQNRINKALIITENLKRGIRNAQELIKKI
ncbi:YdeI/OmpD-associated family protein [Aquimarina spongiae]|uniref:Bacteriocin-protection, YdeI or OmpD-Associated n=1 Tax=Aquimarina spongiae TaxID=570521 RepID=A0A1M6CNW2_9FLAO|nr:YdeI/OmpD-associated family protein [Aquimarina spongiae]SHI62722.1 Bacteriocin-protection, YdeI or OmpD-Associated [Aquimarina spongiae]